MYFWFIVIHQDSKCFAYIYSIRICKNKKYEGNDEPPFQVLSAKDYHIKLPVLETTVAEVLGENVDLSSVAPSQGKEETFATEGGISEDISGNFALAGKTFNSPNAIRELDQEESEVIIENESKEEQISTDTEESDEFQQNQWFSIDNESYEYQSTLRISLLPRKVQIYHSR